MQKLQQLAIQYSLNQLYLYFQISKYFSRAFKINSDEFPSPYGLIADAIILYFSLLSKNKINFLDALSSLIFGLTALFFSFRMVLGARDMFVYQEETMLLAFPIWIPFLPVIASFFLLTICCFYTFIIKVFNIEGN